MVGQALWEEQGEAVARKAIELALKGDGPLMRALLSYVLPHPFAPPLPPPVGPLPMGSMEEVVATFNSVLEKISAGELSPEQGQAVIHLINARCRLFRPTNSTSASREWSRCSRRIPPREAHPQIAKPVFPFLEPGGPDVFGGCWRHVCARLRYWRVILTSRPHVTI